MTDQNPPPELVRTELAADQIMRRVVHTISRVGEACTNDTHDLKVLRQERQAEVAATEKQARQQANTYDPTPLGSKLHQQLMSTLTSPRRPEHVGKPPATLSEAISEWNQLSTSARHEVEGFLLSHSAWHARLLKRAKSEPKIPDDVWMHVDRLTFLYEVAPSLREAFVADKVRERSEALRVVLAAEADRRSGAQELMFKEVREVVADATRSAGVTGAPWSDLRWDSVSPAERLQRCVRLGDLELRLPQTAGVVTAPALVGFPFVAGLALEAGIDDRQNAIDLARSLVMRLLAAVPAGGIQFVVFDPVSLGRSVAEFRHLSEFDTHLMDVKTWTSERDIERRLDELTDHLEVVISGYLRGQFETIDEYNRHAGEVAEPYRVLVVLDYPRGFSDHAARQVLSLIENGPRCGVHTILHYDRSAEFPRDVPIDRLVHGMQRVLWHGERASLVLADPVGAVEHDLLPDGAPPIEFDVDGIPVTAFARLLLLIGDAARKGRTGPVTLDRLFPVLNHLVASGRSREVPRLREGAAALDPGASSTWWTGTTIQGASAPIGRAGAQDVAALNFSSTEVAGGAIVVGVPRSGKSTALHAAIVSLSLIYPPDELELYLIDSKHGVEFKAYDRLPHARMVSINSEREFSVAVLRSLDKEIERRAELMKLSGSGQANITEYRETTGGGLARIVLIMDEFHEVFEEDDDLGRAAFQAFSNIVRQGPFAGVHVVVASQTLSAMPAMDRSTLSLLPMRVAFMCNESDADLVMGDTNREVRALSKQGEGIYNPLRGDTSHNKPFQGLYIDPARRTSLLREVRAKADLAGFKRLPRVFDGDLLAVRPAHQIPAQNNSRLVLRMGEPYDMGDAVTVALGRKRGTSLLLLGADDDNERPDLSVPGAVHTCIIDAAIQGSVVTVLDFLGDLSNADSILDLSSLCKQLALTYQRGRASLAALGGLSALVRERHTGGQYHAQRHVLVLHGLQRALDLTPEDPYTRSDHPVDESPGPRLADILRDGPDVGVHVVVVADGLVQFDRRLGRDLLKEFEIRIAGSAVSPTDLAAITDSFKESPVRRHQLLLADHSRGILRRMRAYPPYASSNELKEGMPDVR